MTDPKSSQEATPIDPCGFQIADNRSKIAVTIGADGTLTIHPDFTVDEAARGFWEAVGQMNPYRYAIAEARRDAFEECAKIAATPDLPDSAEQVYRAVRVRIAAKIREKGKAL